MFLKGKRKKVCKWNDGQEEKQEHQRKRTILVLKSGPVSDYQS
jgi:hypothetical protein